MPKRVRASRAPNCTHIEMDRVYGRDQQCGNCGRFPSIGFLYECKQDCETEALCDLLSAENEDPIEPAKSKVRLGLERAGLSESVILTAEKGHYTEAQLKTLKAQKKDLRQIISDSLQGSQINAAVAKLSAFEKTPSNNDGALNSQLARDTVHDVRLPVWPLLTHLKSPPACHYKACHTCRPYYRDRTYISFQAVLSNQFPPITREDLRALPSKSAEIMRTIGNTCYISPPSASNSTPVSLPTTTSLSTATDAPPTASTNTSAASDLTHKTTQTDLDAISAQRTPRRRFYKVGHRSSGDIGRDLSRQPIPLTRQGLKTAMKGIFRSSRDSSSSGSNITLPLPRTGTVRDLDDSQGDVGDFDLPVLRKVRLEKEKVEAKNGVYGGGFEDVHINGSASGHTTRPHIAFKPANFGDKHGSESIHGSEVEVEGGVALTEEAVEKHTPDILRDATTTTDTELDEGDDANADIGLQSIMAQV
jgi:hypothetical protein